MSKPNILFLVLDAVRTDHTSTYGYERETTPTMSALAEDGVRYDHAFAPSIWTPTVHGAVFTGKYPSHTGIYGNSLGIPDELETLPETLRRHGYRTFAASAGAHIRSERGYARGVDNYVETRRIAPEIGFLRKVLGDRSFAKQVAFSLTRGPDDKTRYKYDRLKRFVRQGLSDGEPFFGFVNAKTAHHPFNPPRPYKGMFCDGFSRTNWEFLERLLGAAGRQTQDVAGHDSQKLRQVAHDGGDGVLAGAVDMSEAEWDVIEAWYDGAIRYLDDLVGEFVSFLRDCGVYDDTLIVLTSDHGDNFGDHGGLTSHIFCLYDTLLHVPLVVKPPATGESGTSTGITVDDQVSLIDLHPTFLEAAGATTPEYEFSESLNDFEERQYHDFTVAEYAGFDGPISRLERKYPEFDARRFARPLQAIRDDQYKLVVTGGQDAEECELYAWRDDPGETTDLSEERPELVADLRGNLREKFPELDGPGEFHRPEDEEVAAQLEELGYL
ncbi:MAG: sulfatase [Salinirussus sp.]